MKNKIIISERILEYTTKPKVLYQLAFSSKPILDSEYLGSGTLGSLIWGEKAILIFFFCKHRIAHTLSSINVLITLFRLAATSVGSLQPLFTAWIPRRNLLLERY